METLQELEFYVSPEDALLMDQAESPAFVAGACGAWSLVPASSPSQARRRRLAAAARARLSIQLSDPASPVL
ncbi:MAG: hypothetical protein FJZ97_06280 [Chloroflexi bacterium]|nr:hypothetical protein [Chloroflexota bacterium]